MNTIRLRETTDDEWTFTQNHQFQAKFQVRINLQIDHVSQRASISHTRPRVEGNSSDTKLLATTCSDYFKQLTNNRF